jgi:methyltransferase (TIGR00027 family)
MKQGRASKTALGAAFFRAMESTFPEGQRVCCDPLARCFLSHGVGITARYHFTARRWKSLLEKKGLGPQYGEVVTRTRYIDDYLEEMMSSGTGQVVILGAGFDTRAYRCASLEGVPVYELDHPDTQKVKRERMAKARRGALADLTCVPIDFDTQDIGERLAAHGYDPARKTLFIWEGVTMYLPAGKIDATLRSVTALSPPGSSIVLNYVYRSTIEAGPPTREAAEFRERLERMGEPVVFGIDEGELEGFMSARGFANVEHAPCATVGRAWFDAAGREQAIARNIGIAHAEVA